MSVSRAAVRFAAVAAVLIAGALWPAVVMPVTVAVGACCIPVAVIELRKERRQP